MSKNQYDTNSDNFQWDWTSSKVKYFDGSKKNTFKGARNSSKWEIIGFMGSDVLFNEDGVVFSTPFARSYSIDGPAIGYGGESGTIILKKEGPDEFIIADGKWRKISSDFLQNLVGSAIAKGNFYGRTDVERSR